MASSTQDLLFDLVLDPTLLDLVLAMPDLTWREIGTTAATLMVWDVLSKPLIAFFWRHARRGVSWGLFRLAVAIDPAVAGGSGQWVAGSTAGGLA
jgi:hypothetical protein